MDRSAPHRPKRLALVALLALAGCNVGGSRPPRNVAVRFEPDAYCGLAAVEGLYDWSGGVATVCPGFSHDAIDEEAVDASSCRVFVADGRGGLAPTDVVGARAAQALRDGSLVVWGWDGTLAVVGRSGARRELAPVAADPWVDADHGRVVFVAPMPGATTLEPGDDRRVVSVDVGSGEETEVVADATASNPLPIPGSLDVLYVSANAGIASIVRVGPTELRTLTNDGLTEAGQAFVPVYGRQVLFAEGGTELVYTAEYDVSVVWSLNVDTGEVRELGPGAWPAFGTDGAVLAHQGTSGAEGCAARYIEGRTP